MESGGSRSIGHAPIFQRIGTLKRNSNAHNIVRPSCQPDAHHCFIYPQPRPNLCRSQRRLYMKPPSDSILGCSLGASARAMADECWLKRRLFCLGAAGQVAQAVRNPALVQSPMVTRCVRSQSATPILDYRKDHCPHPLALCRAPRHTAVPDNLRFWTEKKAGGASAPPPLLTHAL